MPVICSYKSNEPLCGTGVIHDDEGLFHDSVEVVLSGFKCYILWTPEGLMAQLDEDLNGELSVAELNEALRMLDTEITAAMIDSDGDGVITTEEMEAFLRKCNAEYTTFKAALKSAIRQRETKE